MTKQSSGVLATMWFGGELDWLCRACLKSAVRQGHDVQLFSYRDVPNLPDGVAHRDARTVVPEVDIFRFDGVRTPGMTGSFAPFSDVFRYRMLGLGLGTWIDSDVYFVRPLDMDRPLFLCWELASGQSGATDKIGNAVMRIPHASPMLDDLFSIVSKPYQIPPWVPPGLKAKVLEKLDGRPFFPGAVGYATYGPNAVAYYAGKRGLKADILPYDICYPVSWREVDRFGLPCADFLASLPAVTSTVHMWNSRFAKVFGQGIPPGSFAARLKEESLDG